MGNVTYTGEVPVVDADRINGFYDDVAKLAEARGICGLIILGFAKREGGGSIVSTVHWSDPTALPATSAATLQAMCEAMQSWIAAVTAKTLDGERRE